MQRIRIDDDVQPVSAFRAQAAAFVRQVRETKRPLVLTQHGRSAAVLLDVGEYERMVAELELLSDVRTAEQELADGRGITHADALSRVLEAVTK